MPLGPPSRASTAGYDRVVAAIGFVDVVGSTGLALHVPLEDIGRAIEAFEQHAADVVAANHGRVVKFIGDEVMFRVHDAASACRIALEIVERFSNDPLLPGVRAAVAFGDLLVRDGDYFGPVVNLAARATKLAPPGGVVATEEARAAALPAGAFAFDVMPARSLKGFDEPVTLYTIATPNLTSRHPEEGEICGIATERSRCGVEGVMIDTERFASMRGLRWAMAVAGTGVVAAAAVAVGTAQAETPPPPIAVEVLTQRAGSPTTSSCRYATSRTAMRRTSPTPTIPRGPWWPSSPCSQGRSSRGTPIRDR